MFKPQKLPPATLADNKPLYTLRKKVLRCILAGVAQHIAADDQLYLEAIIVEKGSPI
jgi:hypothetical protein